ncbi:MAG: TldD/PmbA family protein [Mariprofundales bacterium]|nr:TldD/PmbA family protein [Mariprofundales bacterium]
MKRRSPLLISDSTALQSAEELVAMVCEGGALHADAIVIAKSGDSISVRNGEVESVEREESCSIGLRAFVESGSALASATASTADISLSGLKRLAQQVIAMARIAEADPDAVPPIGADHPSYTELRAWQRAHDLCDSGWSVERAREAALNCEAAALTYDEAISSSEGAEAGFGSSHVSYLSSDGFAASYSRSSASLSVAVIAGRGSAMQRDYAWHRALHASDLRDPIALGQEAARRAVRRCAPRSMRSGETTVLFEPRTATSLLAHLSAAVNGRAILQQRSFLADSLGEQLFPDTVCIDDLPDHPQGLGNRLFDGEGTRCSANKLVDNGVLRCFLTDRYAANRLQQAATGSAKRGLTGDIAIGAANLVWQPGEMSQQEMIAEIGNGFLVTELIGFGINGVTGDYSRGAGGLLIENGEVTSAVQGVTIAGNLKQMFSSISHVGRDLTWFGSSAAPTVAITGMMVAGQESG